MELAFGSIYKRIVSIGDDNSVRVLKKSGEVLGSWTLDEIEGLAYVAPTQYQDGVLVFCKTYHETLVTSAWDLTSVAHSVPVTKDDVESAEKVKSWLHELKGDRAAADESVPCPACREQINKLAIKCPKCQTVLVSPPTSAVVGSYASLTVWAVLGTVVLFFISSWLTPILFGL